MALSKIEKLLILYKVRRKAMSLNANYDLLGSNKIAVANDHGYAFECYTPIYTQLESIAYNARQSFVKAILEICRCLSGEKISRPSGIGVFFLQLVLQEYNDERMLRATTGIVQRPSPVECEKIRELDTQDFWRRPMVISWVIVHLLDELKHSTRAWAEKEGRRLWKERNHGTFSTT